MGLTAAEQNNTVRKWTRWVRQDNTGYDWYPTYLSKIKHELADEITEHGLENVVAVFAAVSANAQVKRHIPDTRKVCRGEWGGMHGHGASCLQYGLKGSGLGPKTLQFAMAVLGDNEAVVVDRWVLRAVSWEHVPPRANPNITDHRDIAHVIRRVATITGYAPAQVQAIVWTHIRGGQH